jgi:predicted nucleic acid-binding protein
LIRVYVSDALAFEYLDVLSRKLSPAKWLQAQIALRTLLAKAEFILIYYSWRPASPEPGDDLVIDCAMNANALLITANIKDFRAAQTDLGLQILTPLEFIGVLAK